MGLQAGSNQLTKQKKQIPGSGICFFGAGDRTRFTFSSAKKIAVLFPSSREQATVHQGVAFRWDQVFVQHKEDVSRTKHEI